MRLILITLLIIFSSCEKETYFIDLHYDKDIFNNSVYIIAEAEAEHNVKQIDLFYKYLVSSEQSESKSYQEPINSQEVSFVIRYASDIEYIYIIVTDTKGNHKRFDI